MADTSTSDDKGIFSFTGILADYSGREVYTIEEVASAV